MNGTLTAQQGALKAPTRARRDELARLRAIGITLCLIASLLKTVDTADAYQYQKPMVMIYKYHAYALEKLDNDIIQYDCILKLYQQESGWNPLAVNGNHYGIPQGHSRWLKGKNYKVQIDWGIKYINHRYHGNTCKAYKHWSRYGWH